MSKIFFQFGPLTITWYGMMAGIGAIVGLMCLRRLKKFAAMNDDQVYDLLLYAMIAGIIGGRLFYVIQFWSQFRYNRLEIIMINRGGLVFYGGFFLSVIAIYVFSKRNKLSFIRVIDICAPALALAHCMGRIGCFLNGCCFGRKTDLPWGVIFPKGSDSYFFYGGFVKIHPTQLYESLGNLIIFTILFSTIGKLKRGQTASLYIVLYGCLRIFVEMFRGDHKDFVLNLFTPAQFIGAMIVPIGITAFILYNKGEN